MKKLVLVLCLLFLFCCEGGDIVYTGTLSKITYFPEGGFFGRSESWLITFRDTTTFSLDRQPTGGYKLGEVYEIYKTPSAPGLFIRKKSDK